MPFIKRHAGFTIIELMVTFSVLAIIATFAVPSFRDVIISNSVASDRDELFVTLNFARSEAVKRGRAVTVCKSANGSSCDNSLDWTAGWLVFQDDNRDGAKAGTEPAIRAHGALDGQVAVAFSGTANVITYESRGLLLSSASAGTFTFSHSAGSKFDRTIELGVTGRAMKGS
ncbi:MAG: GspH/FimT family pseudopilin [Marinobacter sp.]|nr:GspH/FimT family pseudopilin [Marinobacter sp.]